ncbi:MAG: NAD-dependent malic enzyme [Deltaproteobacteria bacterium]|nr:NAD-dependent malic enzyme [Deltaproteobacteria bacterium]
MSNLKRPLYISYAGPMLLDTPLLNKGSAFSREERALFNLEGLLPEAVEGIAEQAARAYEQFRGCVGPVERHVFLRDIQDTNETLFYKLIRDHLEEMMPVIYTPTVGHACERFSKIYRKARGLFVSYPNRHSLDDMLQNSTRRKVKVIVVTDGERILGLGDQGIGGMGIPIGKLSLYTACGGISPAYTLPVVLDAGTNNEALLNDPMYMGWRHERLTGAKYEEFVDLFIKAVKRRWPSVLLQFEDFAQKNATPLLERYRNELCCFNDDIQGTAAAALGTLIAASHATGRALRDCQIVFVGAGSAGCGMAEQVVAWMRAQGLSEAEARGRVWMVDRHGLVLDDLPDLLPFQRALAHRRYELFAGSEWVGASQKPSLLDVVSRVRPHVLIGASGQPGLFTQEVIEEMARHTERPVVMPLSNPTTRVEATPQQVIEWTKGAAVVATGSPFDPVHFGGRVLPIAQCNNSYIFPGLGLGVVASRARRVTDAMLMTASVALAECSPLASAGVGGLLPPLSELPRVSRKIATAVALCAQSEGVAPPTPRDALDLSIEAQYWEACYRPYRRIPIPF